MLVLPNVTMEPSNVRKKIKVPLNVRKVWSNVILVLPNVTMEPSNVTKKIREPPNVTKYVMLILHNVRMVPSNVRKKLAKMHFWFQHFRPILNLVPKLI